MELNLRDNTLKLFVNEKENVEYFRIDASFDEYKMAINLDDPASVEIVHFEISCV